MFPRQNVTIVALGSLTPYDRNLIFCCLAASYKEWSTHRIKTNIKVEKVGKHIVEFPFNLINQLSCILTKVMIGA